MNRKYSLKKNHDIEKLVSSRNSVGNRYFVVYYKKNEDKTKIAFSVSKKCGNAVVRNHEKRIAREIVRNNFSLLANTKALIVIKPASLMLIHMEKEEKLIELLNKVKEKRC